MTYIVGVQRLSTGAARRFYGKVRERSDGLVTGTVVKYSHIPDLAQTFEIPEQGVLVELGAKHQLGKVYGVDVGERVRAKIPLTKLDSQIFAFTKADAQQLEALHRCTDIAVSRIGKARLPLPGSDLTFELHDKDGGPNKKWAGWLTSVKRGQQVHYIMGLRAQALVSDQPRGLLFLHEYAHYLDSKYLAEHDHVRSAWIKAFLNNFSSVAASEKRAERSLAHLKNVGSIKVAVKELEDQAKADLKWCISQVCRDYKVTPKDLNTLLQAGRTQTLEAMWPPTMFHRNQVLPLVTEYGRTKVSEFFAETCAYYLAGAAIPEKLVPLVEKTFSFIRQQ